MLCSSQMMLHTFCPPLMWWWSLEVGMTGPEQKNVSLFL